MKTPTKRTTRRLTASLAIIAALAAAQSTWATDKYWVAKDGTGNWDDSNWATSITGSGTTFDSGSTALFHQSLNNIDLNGVSPGAWSLRPNSGTSVSNRRVLNFYNTSGTTSTLTINSTGNQSSDFKNMVVTFGGSGSSGKIKVYNNKNNNNSYSLNLKNDTHLIFAANSEYTERDKGTDYIGNSAGTTNSVTVEAGAKVTLADDLYIGNNGTGTLTINGGTVDVSSAKWTRLGYNSGSKGTIILNGGQLKSAHVRKGHNNGAASLVFNGGALVANSASGSGLIDSNLSVTINPGGGMIDNGGRSVAINATLGGTGGLIFTGAGTNTLNAAVNYSGATAVTPGTTLAVANATAKSNILAKGLVLAGVPTAAGQTIMTYTSDLTGSDLSKVKCSLAPDTEFEIGGDGNKSILVKTVGATLDNYWTGAANDGNLSNAANWSNGVPSGNANIFCTNSVTLTKGATFAPSSITFLEGSAKVTIDGDAITGITAITNLSSVRHVFNCAVSGSEIDFYNSVLCCDFNGGITLASATFGGTASDQAKGLVGKWHFTDGWTPVSNNRIYGNSSVMVDGELLNPGNMTIDSGAVVTAATMKVTTSTCSANSNNGRLVVAGTFNLANTSSDFSFAGSNADNATIIVDKIELNTGKWSKMNAKTLVVGDGGINFCLSNYGHLMQFNNSSTLRAGESTLTLGETIDALPQAYVINSGTLTVNTTQFESSAPSTITINGKFLGKDKWSNNYTGGMAVTGNGTLVFNSASTFTGGLTVKDSATVAVRLGACPGSGAVTLEDTSTLEVSQSGTVTLGGNLSIADGAALGFNFTDRTATPVLALVSGKSAAAAGTIKVKITKSDDVAEVSSAGELLTRKITSGFGLPVNTPVALEAAPKWVRSIAVVDGDIVLTLKSKGFFLVIK